MQTLELIIPLEDVNKAKVLYPLLANYRVRVLPTDGKLTKQQLLSREAEVILISATDALKALINSAVLSDYMGSFFRAHNKTFLILPPLDWWFSVPYGKHLFERYISKITAPKQWDKFPDFTWQLCTPEYLADNKDTILKELLSATAVSADIETLGYPRISCISFTSIDTFKTYCIPFTTWLQYGVAKQILEADVPKIFQNGKFDIAYLFANRIKTRAWYFDTLNLAHSHYSEMPKRLSAIGAYYLREVTFWKDTNSYKDIMAHYRYNAYDAYITACVFVAQLKQLPDWALKNYVIQFPREHICLYMGFTGLPIDVEKLKTTKQEYEERLNKLLAKLESWTFSGFLPTSPKQVLIAVNAIARIFAKTTVDSTDDATLKELATKHPLCHIFISALQEFRELSKFNSTYLDALLFKGRLLYTINAAGTDTGRMASSASSFSIISRIKTTGEPEWRSYGMQVQNIPAAYKKLVRAPEGWLFAEIDYSQAESRCTAYLSGDENLINTVENSPDFHCTNASLFFGIPFEQLYDAKNKKKLNPELRDLAKRVNHGANYNMGPGVLLQTMGIKNVLRAKALLSLPNYWTPMQVAEHLLSCFEKAYPKIKKDYYNSVKNSIRTTRKLVSPLGWTRYCFGDPDKSKMALNAYVAHGPQNLSVQILNIGMERVYSELLSPTFRLLAQIHDSLLFMFQDTPENREKILRAKELVTIPIPVNGKTLLIPPDLSKFSQVWSDTK